MSHARHLHAVNRFRAAIGLVPSVVVGTCLTFANASCAEIGPQGAMNVSVVRVASRCFSDRLMASGVFVARQVVDIRPERDELVVSDVLAEAGDRLVKDQLLARLVSPKAPNQAPIELKAPVGGTVISANATVGAYASTASSTPLFRIASGTDLDLEAKTLAANLPKVRQGMTAKVHVVGLGSVDGRVASIGDVDMQTQLGALRIAVVSDARLRFGGFARAEVQTGRECGPAVPLSAVAFGDNGAVVATVQADRVVMRHVSPGLMERDEVQIRDGLSLNDVVVARAAPFLRDGDEVHPVLRAP